MITAKVGFTFDELPEGHSASTTLTGSSTCEQMFILARATYSHPGGPPEIEILGCDLVSLSTKATVFDIEETEKMEEGVAQPDRNRRKGSRSRLRRTLGLLLRRLTLDRREGERE